MRLFRWDSFLLLRPLTNYLTLCFQPVESHFTASNWFSESLNDLTLNYVTTSKLIEVKLKLLSPIAHPIFIECVGFCVAESMECARKVCVKSFSTHLFSLTSFGTISEFGPHRFLSLLCNLQSNQVAQIVEFISVQLIHW